MAGCQALSKALVMSKDIIAMPLPFFESEDCMVFKRLRLASSVLCSVTKPNCFPEIQFIFS